MQLQDYKKESFSNGEADGSENVPIKMDSRFFSNIITIIPTRFICQMQMKFPGVEFLKTAPKFRKRKKNSSSCVHVVHNTSHQKISRPGRAVTTKKWTTKCLVRAELLCWLLSQLLF